MDRNFYMKYKPFFLSMHKEMRRENSEGFFSHFCITAEFEQKCCT